ncbi:MAG: phytanoyl-CoA dioxygenase family protein [Sneathiella sp.]|nr:phytanoyl-CoA dioxygenase family protein [Sneathiella sp.]
MPDLSKREWERLCLSLTIGGPISAVPCQFTDVELTEIADAFWDTGYLNIPPVFKNQELEPLVRALEIFDEAKIPPAYIYIFDQPWVLFEKLRVLIAHLLGAEYALLPNLWAWHLRSSGVTGWPPHRDCDSDTVFSVGPDQMLMSLSLWVPLTHADEDNGCMFVIPRQQEENLEPEQELTLERLKPFATSLPVAAGSVLGWPQDLIHWGGTYGENAKGPRMSLSFEFQNTSFAPLAEPMLDTANPPPFDQRLSLIQEQFSKYQHIAPDLS